MIIIHELQKQNLTWKQFNIRNGFEIVEEEVKEEQILVMTNDEEEIQNPKATSSKQPIGRRRTRSMVKREKEFEEKDKIFTTYESKSRKRQQVQKGQIKESDDEAQQAQYAHIQTLEKQKETQSLENDDFEGHETSTYEQMRKYVEQLIEDMKDETQPPQTVEQIKEMAGGSTSKLDKRSKKIKKMRKRSRKLKSWKGT
jgi:hypothetical protein